MHLRPTSKLEYLSFKGIKKCRKSFSQFIWSDNHDNFLNESRSKK